MTLLSNSSFPKKGDKVKDSGLWRDLTAYWILGLCNNYGYVVMLSAAHDIISRMNNPNQSNELSHESNQQRPETERICQMLSTGAILLADIIPTLFIKAIVPFLPLYMNFRVFLACVMQVCGFLLVAFGDSWLAILGVVFTSLSHGLGEASFLQYSAKFHKNVISTWSSGTGGAGIFGSFSYAALISFGLSPLNTILVMLIVPILEGVTFWLLLRNPRLVANIDLQQHFLPMNSDPENVVDETEANITFGDKIRYVPSLLKYMIPIFLVYLFEYFINQGLLELVYFKNIWIDHSEQYRWLQVDYQLGVFLSRSSVNLCQINKIWLLAILQFLNVLIILDEVITFITPSIWIIFAVVFFEGLLGGGAYVNTFYRMSREIPEKWRNFALGIVPLADSCGISLAGILAIPVHNSICKLPMHVRT